MGEKTDRLVALTSVNVSGYTRRVHGHPVHVKGYVRRFLSPGQVVVPHLSGPGIDFSRDINYTQGYQQTYFAMQDKTRDDIEHASRDMNALRQKATYGTPHFNMLSGAISALIDLHEQHHSAP